MSGSAIRYFAIRLLRFAVRLAPSEKSDWPQAMLAELYFIDGDWSSLYWALGASGVLAKRAFFDLLVGRKSPATRFQSEVFSSEIFMRKTTLLTSGLSVLLALSFFVVPQFRQAFQISLSAWHEVFHVADRGQTELDELAKRGWEKHDAEGLAFAAARIWNDEKGAKWANEAVRLDPKLIWVYAIVAVRHSTNPEIKNWLPTVKTWDPQNALFHLIDAENIDIEHVRKGTAGHEESDPEWLGALNAAFYSKKFDDYMDRLHDLDRSVVRRYSSIDPAELVFGGNLLAVPTYAFSDTHKFAETVLQEGQKLEAGGHAQAAAEKYWLVARFGETVNAGAHSESVEWMGSILQAKAYKRLEAQFEKDGNQQEAALMSYLITQLEQAEEKRRARLNGFFTGHEVATRDATLVRACGLMMILFAGVIVVLSLAVIARRLERTSVSLGANQLISRIGFGAAVGFLLCAITLFATYRPYRNILDHITRTGDTTQLPELSAFLARAHSLPGTWGTSLNFTVHFWAAVSCACAVSLVLVLLPRALGVGRSRCVSR